MAFSFSGRDLPLSVRVCRTLVWTQAVYTFFAGLFVVLAGTLLNGSLPFHGGTISGGGAAVIGLVYVVVAAVLTWLGVSLGRLAPWARTGIVMVQVFLATFELLRAFDLSLSTLITVTLCALILVLLFVPDTQRVLGGPAQA